MIHDTLQAPLPERFASKFTPGTGDQCWEWTAGTNGVGYGMFYPTAGRSVAAHRAVYELLVGLIPPGLDLDHMCHNESDCPGGKTCVHRRCVNPSHLEPSTRRENLLRGRSLVSKLAARTHCPMGHPYDEVNTMTSSTERGRRCRACRLKQRRDAYRARLKESV